MMYCAATIKRHYHTKYTHHLQQLHLSKVVIERKLDNISKLWEILSRSYILSMTGDGKLCGKLPIINSQRPHWNTINTGGTHHDPNHKGGTNN